MQGIIVSVRGRALAKLRLIAVLIFTMSLLGSCQENNDANLAVTVVGFISGSPRKNITVQLYNSNSDAKDEVNPVTKAYDSNSQGLVVFRGLSSGRIYFVRADATLTKSITLSPKLVPGDNELTVSIL